jgi:hypothetical protein
LLKNTPERGRVNPQPSLETIKENVAIIANANVEATRGLHDRKR